MTGSIARRSKNNNFIKENPASKKPFLKIPYRNLYKIQNMILTIIFDDNNFHSQLFQILQMKTNFLTHQTSHLVAFAAAAFVHVGIAAWSMMPSNPIVINQQAIQVSFVAPSANNQKSENPSHKKIAFNIERENALKQKKNDKNETAENKIEKKSIVGKQTSGRVDPNAVATKAAETDPVFDAAYLNNPAPEYPTSAKQRNIQGKVLLNVVVKVDGTPAQVMISRSSGSSLLDEAAVDAVKQWRFIPARRSGESVQANVIVPVEFKII